MKQRSRATLLIIFGVIGFILLIIFPLIPVPRTITQQPDQAMLSLSINRRYVLLPTYCVWYAWQVEGIQRVTFDNKNTIGNASQEACHQTGAEVPRLSVQKVDGGFVDLVLAPTILIFSLPYQLALFFFGGVALIGVALTGMMKPVLRVAQVLVVWLVIAAVSLEGGLRVWIASTGTDTEKLIYTGSVADIIGQQRQFVAMPYLNYGLNPRAADVNDLGFRGDEIDIEKPDDTFRILALGGSTTYGWEIDADQSYPAQLERILHDEYGFNNVQVINGGVPSYTTWNTLTNLAFRGLELDPDLILIYHAYNDANLAMLTTPNCYRGQNLNFGLGNATNWTYTVPDLSWSAAVRFYTINRGIVPNPMERREDPLWGEGVSDCDTNLQDYTREELLERNGTDYYTRNLRAMIALAHEFDVVPVFSTFAMDKASAYASDYPERVAGVELFNAALLDVAAASDVAVIDLANRIPEQPDLWQIDAHHLTADGVLLQAAVYADFLVSQDLLTGKAQP